MEHLSKDQCAQLKQALDSLVTELEAALEDNAEAAQPVDLDGSIGRVTRIDAIQQQSMAKATRETNRRRLAAAGVALKALDEGTYGECFECGEEIPFQRLLARPESLLCIDCKEEREQR